MSKGLSLDQFRSQLESDSQKKCILQEETIKGLHQIIKDREQLIIENTKLINQLQNRCFAITSGTFCPFCGCRFQCKKGRYRQND